MHALNACKIRLGACLIFVACGIVLFAEAPVGASPIRPNEVEASPFVFEITDKAEAEVTQSDETPKQAEPRKQARPQQDLTPPDKADADKTDKSPDANKTGTSPDAKPDPQSTRATSNKATGKSTDKADAGFRVKPYGSVWADMIYETNPTNPGAFTFWVFSEDAQAGPQFIVDARRTRLGLNIDGPKLTMCGSATSRAQVEVDFFGQFVNENQSNVQFRQAYWEAFNDDFRFVVGQTNDVISPRNTRTLNYSVGWAGGNIGFRRAQFRWERYWEFTPLQKGIWQLSLNQDIVNDFGAEPTVRREPAAWPVIEGRGAIQIESWHNDSENLELGVSAHIGEVGFDFLAESPPPLVLPPERDVRLSTWSANVDWMIPISNRVSVQGEVFTGSNLSAYLGGIVQGVCSCTRETIRSTGGWADLEYRWTDRITSATGFGIDDPKNSDLFFGRSRNQFLFANMTYRIRTELLTGIEVSYWQTRYQDRRSGLIPDELLAPTASGNSVVVQWMWKYTF